MSYYKDRTNPFYYQIKGDRVNYIKYYTELDEYSVETGENTEMLALEKAFLIEITKEEFEAVVSRMLMDINKVFGLN